MPNWWLIWAEHLARVLAEWWVRVRSTDPGDDARDGESRPAGGPHLPTGDDDG